MDTIIANYLNGAATSYEKEMLLSWLKEDDSHRKHFAECREAWLASGAVLLSGKEKKKAFRLFEERVNHYELNRKSFKLFTVFRVAAAVLILLTCVAGGFYIGKNQQISESAQQTVVMNQALMGADSKGSFTLPDGTIAWLNAGSKLTYPTEFAPNYRKVILEGEGYFEVKQNEKAPFFVETETMDIRVLGTTFDVQSYSKKEVAETILLSGKVEVQLKGHSDKIQLEPNQKISFNKTDGTSNIVPVNASEYALWIQDKLILNNETLATILRKMERWYGIEIVCQKDVPRQLRLSMTIRRETKEEIFKLLELIAPVKCCLKEDKIVINTK